MAMTPSTMGLPLGSPAPDFTLPDPDGKTTTLSALKGKPTVVAFLCNHCPFVKHIADELGRFSQQYEGKVNIVGVMPNDFAKHPDDAPARMKEEAAARGYRFAYLVDESQEVAKAYQAACTPDFFVLDGDHNLAYRGQMDGARPNNDVPVDAKDLREVVDALLSGGAVPSEQTPSIGCNIKWIKGNEPAYYG